MRPRPQAFEKAGADVLFAPGLPDLAAVRAVCAAVSKPVNFMAGIKGRSFSVGELAVTGVRRISLATSLYRAAITGLLDAAYDDADVRRQRHFGPSRALASNRDLTAFPIDIFQLQADDFAGTESKPSKQHQDRVIAPSVGSSNGLPQYFLIPDSGSLRKTLVGTPALRMRKHYAVGDGHIGGPVLTIRRFPST